MRVVNFYASLQSRLFGRSNLAENFEQLLYPLRFSLHLRNTIFIFFCPLFCFFSFTSKAVLKTAVASGNWSSSAIWTPAGVPAVGDSVTIGPFTITVDGAYTCSSLLIDDTGGGSTATINTGQSLTITGDLTFGGSGSFNNILNVNAGTLIVGGRLIGRNPTSNLVSINITTGTASFTRAAAWTWGTSVNLTITGSGSATVTAPLTLSTAATTLSVTGAGGNITFIGAVTQSDGTISALAGTVTFNAGLTLSGTGLVSTSGGTLTFNALVTQTGGTISCTVAATLNFNTGYTKSGGTFASSFGETINFGGNFTNIGLPLTLASGSTAVFNAGTPTITPTGAITFSNLQINAGVTVTLAGNISVIGNWTNTGGTFTPGTNTVTFKGSATQTITKAGGETFYNLTTNTTGPVILASNVMVTNTLNMTAGNYNLNANTLTLGNSAAATLMRSAGIMYGGTFRRWLPVAAISSTAAPLYGLFPMGNSTDYRPVEINSTVNPITAGFVSAVHTSALTVTDVAYNDNEAVAIQRITDQKSTLSTSGGFAGGTYNLDVSMTTLGNSGVLTDLKMETIAGPPYGVGTTAATTGTLSAPTVKRTGLTAVELVNDFVVASNNKTTTPIRQFYYSRATGAWDDVVSVWSLTNGGPACGCMPSVFGYAVITVSGNVSVNAPATIDFVDINAGAVLNGTANFTVNNDLTTAGAGYFSPNAGIWTVNRNVILNGTGSSNTPSGGMSITGNLTVGIGTTLTLFAGLTVSGNLVDDGTLSVVSNVITLDGGSKNISGAGTITGAGSISVPTNKTILAGTSFTIAPTFAISGATTITNNGAITLQNDLTGTVAGSTWINAVGSTLNITGTLFAIGTLNASASPNTVNYNGSAAQTVKIPASTYYNLTVSNAGTKTAGGAITISNMLTIQNAVIFSDASFAITGAGGLTMSGTSQYQIANGISPVPSLNGTYNLTGGTINFNAAGGQDIRSINGPAPNAYYNLTCSNTGVKTLAGDITAQGDLLIAGTAQLDVVGNSSDYNITLYGNWNVTSTNANPFNEATGTVTFSGSTLQAITTVLAGGETFNNLTIANTGAGVTLGSSLTVTAAFIHTGGIINLNGQVLTLNGTIIFPVSSANGAFTGSNTSDLFIFATSITNNLFFTVGAQTLGNFTLNSIGQTLTLGTALTVANTFTHTNGVINLNGQTLALNGAITFPASVANGCFSGSATSSLSVGGAGTITNFMNMTQIGTFNNLNNITLNRTGQTLTLGNLVRLVGTLTPTAGIFAANGNLILIATSPGVVARIATIGPTGSVTGNVTVQSYAKGGNTGWTTLGAAGITGRTFADWNDNFAITCLTCPNGYMASFTSIQSYDETVGGLFDNPARYAPILNVTDAMTIGKGYWVYLGNGTTTTTDIIIDVTGPVNQGNFVYNITMTTGGGGTDPVDHGYNLLANPYPSPISWALLRNANANVANAIYVYNPDLNGYASYVNGISSPAVGAGGMGDFIPAGQAFYVKANAATTLTALETNKGASTQVLLKTNGQQQINANPMLLRLQASGNSMKFETAVYFDANATTNYEIQYDALYLGTAAGFLGIATTMGGKDYAINGLPALNQNFSIPVKVTTATTGVYQIVANDIQTLPLGACLILHDNYTNTNHNLRAGPYSCTLTDTEKVARFILNITINNTLQVTSSITNPSCGSSANGFIVASANSAGPWNYLWKDASNAIIKTTLNKTTSDTLKNLNSGNYSVDINTIGTSCDNGTKNFSLQGALTPGASFNQSSTSVVLIASSVCVTFTNTSNNATSYWWNFGDGTSSPNTNNTHCYTSPGNFTVTLTAYNTSCGDSAVYTQVITVIGETPNGIAAYAEPNKNMFISRDAAGYYVQFNYKTKTNAVITVKNILGEKVTDDLKPENISADKVYIPLGNNENKILILSVVAETGEKTYCKIVNY